MSQSNVNPSRSPSPEYYDASSKRLRLDPSYLETSSNGAVPKTAQDFKRIQEEFATIYNGLQMEAEKFEEKIEELGEQVQSRDRIIAELRHEEGKLRQENEELRQENSELQEDLVREKSVKQEAVRAQATAEDKLCSLENTVDDIVDIISYVRNSRADNSTSQQGSILENSHFQEVRMSVNLQTVTPEMITPEQREVLEAKAKRADELEEELRVANNTISSLRQASLEQQSSMEERVDDAEELQQPMETLENDSESEDDDDENSSLPASSDHTEANELYGAPREQQSSVQEKTDKLEKREKLMEMLKNDWGREDDEDSLVSAADNNTAEINSSDKHNSSSNDKPDDDKESVMPENEEQQHDDSRILIGKKYRFYVSGSQFLEIDWDRECEFIENSKWVCKKCPYETMRKPNVEDHVWIKHYEGYFQCPHCSDPPAHFSWRATVMRHIRNQHPQLSNV